jgi:ElaB/YqjD/DUF883 family membrane-anchored ribosome-binding protein
MRTYEKYAGNGADAGTQSSKEIERDLEHIRNEMRETLAAIEERLSPRQLFEQVKGRFGDEPSEMLANLGRSISDNPVPLLLIAAGVGMMWRAESGRSSRREGGEGLADKARGTLQRARERGDEMAGAAVEKGRAWRERAEGALEGEGEGEGESKGKGEQAAGAARGAVARIKGTGRQLEQRTRSYLQEQPLVLVGLGLALGVMAGAALPTTAKEEQAMGGVGEHLQERAKRIR